MFSCVRYFTSAMDKSIRYDLCKGYFPYDRPRAWMISEGGIVIVVICSCTLLVMSLVTLSWLQVVTVQAGFSSRDALLFVVCGIFN